MIPSRYYVNISMQPVNAGCFSVSMGEFPDRIVRPIKPTWHGGASQIIPEDTIRPHLFKRDGLWECVTSGAHPFLRQRGIGFGVRDSLREWQDLGHTTDRMRNAGMNFHLGSKSAHH